MIVSVDETRKHDATIEIDEGATIITGAEFYNGPKGSLYDITDGFMNSIYVALKVDF